LDPASARAAAEHGTSRSRGDIVPGAARHRRRRPPVFAIRSPELDWRRIRNIDIEKIETDRVISDLRNGYADYFRQALS
jgi:hypothetical protein